MIEQVFPFYVFEINTRTALLQATAMANRFIKKHSGTSSTPLVQVAIEVKYQEISFEGQLGGSAVVIVTGKAEKLIQLEDEDFKRIPFDEICRGGKEE